MKKLAPSYLVTTLSLALGGCLEGNPNYKPECVTPDNNISSVCDQNYQFCSPSRRCVDAHNTIDPHYPQRQEGALDIVFPMKGALVGGNTLIVNTMSNDVANVEYWAIDARMTRFKLGEGAIGSLPWKPSDVKDTTHLFLRAFDARGFQIEPDSPPMAVTITAK